MASAITLTDQTFDQEVVKSDKPVLVDFWAPWCGPCQLMAPILDELAGELENKIKIAKLNVDEPAHQTLAMEYQIQSIPNMKLFKDGKIVKEFIGARSKEEFKKELEEELGKN